MTPEQFEEIFEKTIDQFEATSKLRDFILKMATEGKLTSQLENSEADATLNQNIDLAYIPHALPTSWFWHRLDQVCIYDAGKKIEPESLDQQGWLLELEDLEKQTGRLLSRICVSERKPKSTKSAFEAGDVLYGKLRPYLTKVLVARENGYSTSEILSLRPQKELITPDYLAICLRRPDIVSHVTRIGMGTKMPRLRTNDGKALPIPLPLLEEQKRIVAKVDELMALCDELENTNQKTNRTKLTYLKSVTQHIFDSAPGGDKQDSLSSAFERAPRNAEGIQELKKVCINFGIYMDQQSDEENRKFFDKMQEHTDKMKADKALPKSFSIQKSESELFSSIACLSLGSVAFIEKGKTGIKSAEPGEYPLVVTAAERQTCKSYDFETKAAIVPLVSSTGHGHASIQRLHYQSGKFALGTILAAIVPFDEGLFSSRFIYEYLNTFKEELLVSKMTGTANVTLSVSKISEVPIPMVSPRSQKWICDFCETCDQIEISLHEEDNIKAKLLKTLVA